MGKVMKSLVGVEDGTLSAPHAVVSCCAISLTLCIPMYSVVHIILNTIGIH